MYGSIGCRRRVCISHREMSVTLTGTIVEQTQIESTGVITGSLCLTNGQEIVDNKGFKDSNSIAPERGKHLWIIL